jgi:hypothetical protein
MSYDTLDLQGFAGGGELEVPCDRIDAELDRIWRGIAQRAQSAGARRIAVNRACLLNLVIHAGDGPSEVVGRFTATALTDHLPARVIVIRARPGEPGDGAPRAFVAASRNPMGEGRAALVSGELVLLEARGAQLDRVPAVVRATLEPDLATTLWWTGPTPPPRSYVAALRDIADRVVVDSEAMADDRDVSHLLPLPGSGRLADLTWPRLEPWRTAMARAFDVPEHRGFLAAVDGVRVAIGARGSSAPDASAGPLLVGWLAAALGWDACARDADRAVCFRSPGGAGVRVTIGAQPSEHRSVVEVTLSSAGRTCRFRRTREDTVAVDVPDGFAPVRPVRFREVDPVGALGATLLDVRADPIAPEAVRRAAEIAAALAG